MTNEPTFQNFNPQALLDEGGAASAALDLIQEAVVLLDMHNQSVLWANAAAETLWGRDDLRQCRWDLLVRPEPDSWRMEGLLTIARAGGSQANVHAKSLQLHWRNRTVVLLVLHEEFALQAALDPLTELPTRGLLEQRLAQLRESPQSGSWAVVFIDLDDFKKINDACGHFAGDAVLTEVARRLRSAVREDDLLVRWGGDEFVVLAPWRGGNWGAASLAHRIQAELARPLLLDGDQPAVRLSGSLGIALTHRIVDGRLLLGAADAAMFQSKALRPGGFRIVLVGGDAEPRDTLESTP